MTQPSAFRGALAAVVVAPLLAVVPPSVATAARSTPSGTDLAGVTCVRQGHITVTPGLTATPADFTFAETFRLGPCFGGSGQLVSGLTAVAQVAGKGHGSCLYLEGTATDHFTWSDGSRSTAHVAGGAVSPYAFAEGAIVSGRSAGTPMRTGIVFVPTDSVTTCVSTGLREADFYGEYRFG